MGEGRSYSKEEGLVALVVRGVFRFLVKVWKVGVGVVLGLEGLKFWCSNLVRIFLDADMIWSPLPRETGN